MTTLKIKIDLANKTEIESQLVSVNGKSTAHTYTDFGNINSIAEWAESRLGALHIPKSMRRGAKVSSISGGKVARCYTGRFRNATAVTIERGAAAWFLVSAARTEISQDGGGPDRLTLTPEQDVEAIAQLRKNYRVAAVAVVKPTAVLESVNA